MSETPRLTRATGVLSAVIGFILASAFSAILVYAQELVPGKVGMISGLFFGLAFGIEGINRTALALSGNPREGDPFFYAVRAFAFLLILYAIWDKNRPGRR